MHRKSGTNESCEIEIWQSCDHFSTTIPSNYTSQKLIDSVAQGNNGGVDPCSLSCLLLSPSQLAGGKAQRVSGDWLLWNQSWNLKSLNGGGWQGKPFGCLLASKADWRALGVNRWSLFLPGGKGSSEIHWDEEWGYSFSFRLQLRLFPLTPAKWQSAGQPRSSRNDFW